MFRFIGLLEAIYVFVSSCPYINQRFESTLILPDDGCIIDSCTFNNIIGDAIIITDLTNITIRNCHFTNIGKDGITFAEQSIENSSLIPFGVIIQNNTFSNIQNCAIQIDSQTEEGYVHIIHNKIHQVGCGMSIKGSIANYTIDSNILYNISTHAISYLGTQTSMIIIQNNMLYNVDETVIFLNINSAMNYNILVRFNTIISDRNRSTIHINGKGQIYGNILLSDSHYEEYISADNMSQLLLMCNLQSSDPSEIGFVNYDRNMESSAIDLHISQYSWMEFAYCNGHNFSLPKFDIDGDVRGVENRIDVGADRIQTQLDLLSESKTSTLLFILMCMAVLILCVIFVTISGYRKHKQMQKIYKNAKHFVTPRTRQQTNKIMKMMVGGDSTNTGHEEKEMKGHSRANKGNISKLRKENRDSFGISSSDIEYPENETNTQKESSETASNLAMQITFTKLDV